MKRFGVALHGQAVMTVSLRGGEIEYMIAEHGRDWRAHGWEIFELTPDGETVATPTVTDPEACPGCGSLPGDGRTAGCLHPDGCGYFA